MVARVVAAGFGADRSFLGSVRSGATALLLLLPSSPAAGFVVETCATRGSSRQLLLQLCGASVRTIVRRIVAEGGRPLDDDAAVLDAPQGDAALQWLLVLQALELSVAVVATPPSSSCFLGFLRDSQDAEEDDADGCSLAPKMLRVRDADEEEEGAALQCWRRSEAEELLLVALLWVPVDSPPRRSCAERASRVSWGAAAAVAQGDSPLAAVLVAFSSL